VSQITSANSGRKASCDQTCLPLVFATPGWDTMATTTSFEGGQSMRTIEESSERRRTTRYGIEARVIFNWGTSQAESCPFEGTTRDISLAGAFILAATCPPLDSMLEMEVALPSRDGASRYVIRSWMTVLRVEHDPADAGPIGFAAVGRIFSLQDVSTDPDRPSMVPPENLEVRTHAPGK
jgi:hypothetical protein